jgi:hypothetical protein
MFACTFAHCALQAKRLAGWRGQLTRAPNINQQHCKEATVQHTVKDQRRQLYTAIAINGAACCGAMYSSLDLAKAI